MKIAAENSRIQIKMAIKQPILILFIFFSLLLLPSSTKILHPEELQENNIGETIEHGKYRGDHTGQYSLSRITTNRAGHGGSSGGSSGGSVGGGSVGGSRGSSGDGSTSDSGKPYGAGSANINRHHHGASNRLQDSALLTWVIVIFAAQFTTQVL